MNTVLECFEHSACNFLNVVLIELLKYDDIINPVKELGTEALLQFAHDCVFNITLAHCAVAFLALEAECGVAGVCDELCTDVGSHDDDAVLEVNLSALRIGENTVVKDLKEHVEYIGVSLFNLVEKNHAVGLTANLFGELTAFVISDIARR